MIYERIDAQCYVKKAYDPLFTPGTAPALCYMCKITPERSHLHTRVMHAHKDVAELVLIYSGESDYLVDNKIMHVKSGDLLVYNSGVVHDEYTDRKEQIGFYCAGIRNLSLPGLPENAFCLSKNGYVFHTGERFEDIRAINEMIFTTLVSGEPNAERFCDHLMYALVDKVLNVIQADAACPGLRPSDDVNEPSAMSHRIKAYIDEHYMEPISLETIGNELHISPWYASRLFKSMTGYSPIQYLLRRRIGEAQTLLISTDLPITEIAFRVGYDTQSYFNAQFTKYVGMPPKQFRMNYVVSSPKKKI